MGNLLINSDCFFNLSELSPEEKNKVIENFIEATYSAQSGSDLIFQDKNLAENEYQFGNYYNDFIFIDWGTFCTKEEFLGIDQKNHQELANLFMAQPSGGVIFESIEHFREKFNTSLFGFLGIKVTTGLTPYIECYNSWNYWHINYLKKNNKYIFWTINNECSLPNIRFSNLYLAQLVDPKINPKNEKEIKERAKEYCDNFASIKYNKNRKRALAREIGRVIAERNYFTENNELSQLEARIRKAERLIFEIEKQNRMLYISIDFHKCSCYELCDHNGKHLGEFRFDGLENSKADPSGEHDIWALTKK